MTVKEALQNGGRLVKKFGLDTEVRAKPVVGPDYWFDLL